MYSPVDGYRCTATAVAAGSRRVRPLCSTATAAAAASPLLFNTERSQCGMTAAAAAGPMSFYTERSQCRMAANNISSRSDVV